MAFLYNCQGESNFDTVNLFSWEKDVSGLVFGCEFSGVDHFCKKQKIKFVSFLSETQLFTFLPGLPFPIGTKFEMKVPWGKANLV